MYLVILPLLSFWPSDHRVSWRQCLACIKKAPMWRLLDYGCSLYTEFDFHIWETGSMCIKSTPERTFHVHTHAHTHCTWDFHEFPKVYRRHSKVYSWKVYSSKKKRKKTAWHKEMMEACDILPEDILCQSLWRKQLHQSLLYLGWWRQECRWARTASGVEEGWGDAQAQ